MPSYDADELADNADQPNQPMGARYLEAAKSISVTVAARHMHRSRYPPHLHIMLWVPGYSGSEIPHFYMDATGRIVRNSFIMIPAEQGPASAERKKIILEKQQTRAGEYAPGRLCQLMDLEGHVELELTVPPEGGLLMSRGKDDEPYLLIGAAQGAGDAVEVRKSGKTLLWAKVVDDAEHGHTDVTIRHLREDGMPGKIITQELHYDPFTGLNK